jgi:hypothetical protein
MTTMFFYIGDYSDSGGNTLINNCLGKNKSQAQVKNSIVSNQNLCGLFSTMLA